MAAPQRTPRSLPTRDCCTQMNIGRRGYVAESTGIEVLDGFLYLFFRVHDERAETHDGLVERLAAQHQERRVIVSRERNMAGLAVHHDQLTLARNSIAVDLHGTPQKHQRDGTVPREAETRASTLLQSHVPHING